MPCRLTLILFWTLLSLCGTGAERPLVSDELEDFRARYETDFELISEKLRHVSGRLKLTTLMNDEKGRFVSSNQDTGTFAISGPLGKCVLDVKRNWMFLTFQHSYVYGKLDDTAFTLSKRKGFSSYSMDQYDTPNQAGQIKPVSPLRFLDYQPPTFVSCVPALLPKGPGHLYFNICSNMKIIRSFPASSPMIHGSRR